MKFYFNEYENICMDEDSLVKLIQDVADIEEEDVREELHTRREFCGWYECEVSDAIKEKFNA